MIAPLPIPRFSASAVMRAMASADSSPSKPLLFTVRPGPSYAASIFAGSSARSGGWITTRMGRPYFRANSKSRVSCAGTDMMAPVPYPVSTKLPTQIGIRSPLNGFVA